MFQARSPIIHISVTGNMLYCSTLKDSLSLIQFNPAQNTFQAVVSDPRPRLSTFHFAMQNQVIVADKIGDLVGLTGDGIFPIPIKIEAVVPTRHKSFEEVFQARIYSPVSRLREGILRGPKIGDNDLLKQPALLAMSIDGSISIIKSTTKSTLGIYQWLEEYLSQVIDDPPLFQPGNPQSYVSELIDRTYLGIV